MALFLLLVMLTACAAEPQDLTDKMFTFPQETDTAHFKLNTPVQRLNAVTVCQRTFSDLTRSYALFSLATQAHHNSFLIFRSAKDKVIELHVRNKAVAFPGFDFQQNTWNSLCATWDSVSGLGQIWLDGKPSSRKYITSGTVISGPFSIVLGQEQDSFGGSFDAKQSFVGMMSDVHMWNSTVHSCEIKRYTDKYNLAQGNVLQWGALDLQAIGRVLIEQKQLGCD